jgi:hypothetical protein
MFTIDENPHVIEMNNLKKNSFDDLYDNKKFRKFSE